MCGISQKFAIVLPGNGRLSHHFDLRALNKLFSRKFRNYLNQAKNRVKIKKEPGETNFLGLFCESLFRDNALVCGGMCTKFVIAPNKTVVCPAILAIANIPNRVSKNFSKNNKNPAKQAPNLSPNRVLIIKSNKKRARGNEFPRTLSKSFFRDNEQFCGGQAHGV